MAKPSPRAKAVLELKPLMLGAAETEIAYALGYCRFRERCFLCVSKDKSDACWIFRDKCAAAFWQQRGCVRTEALHGRELCSPAQSSGPCWESRCLNTACDAWLSLDLSLQGLSSNCRYLIHLSSVFVRKAWRFRKDSTDCFCICTTMDLGTPAKSASHVWGRFMYRYKQRKFLFSERADKELVVLLWRGMGLSCGSTWPC